MMRRRIDVTSAPSGWIALAIIAVGGLAIWLVFGHGYANYDTFYALLWGDEIFHGHSPDYGAPIPPTPHPLATFAGILLGPLEPGGAEGVVLAISFLSLAAIAYLVYRLGSSWFNPWVGALAALIVLTRQPIVLFTSISYVDVPYVALVLAALALETRHRRAGWPVLVLLALAGLIRPEAWLFSAAYLIYLAYADPEQPRDDGILAPAIAFVRRREFLPLLAVAAAGPLIWALYDLIISGDPLYSLTGTRDTVSTLQRDTGLFDAVTLGPRRLGEIVREPVLVGAVGGGALTLAFLRPRALLGVAAGVVAVLGFLVLATAGLAVITRYLLLVAMIVIIFAAAGVFGWLNLPPGHPWRRRWMAFGVLVGLLFVILGPVQAKRLGDLRDSIAFQQGVRDDLKALTDAGEFRAGCEPISVPNHRPVPLLALWLDRRPSEIVTAVREQDDRLVRVHPRTGYFLDPATRKVEREYVLDPNDPGELSARVPRGFDRVAQTDSWTLFARCRPATS
jgi:hypothetical protein